MSDPPAPLPGPKGSPGQSRSPALRASDADRERAVDVLRRAAGEGRLDIDELDERLQRAYATRTVAELEELTADVAIGPAAAAAAATSAGVVVRPGEGGTRAVVAIMGGHERSGRWRLAPSCQVINIMGGSDLDLTRAELSDHVTTLNVLAIMGGGEIRVPDGVDVQVSKLALMGGNDVKLKGAPAAPGAPLIRIRLLSIMGGITVRQGPKKRRADKRRERELRRGELGE